MLAPIGLSRGKNCFLTCRVKCRPPEGVPKDEEIAACAPILRRELSLLKPLAVLSFERNLSAPPGAAGKKPVDFPGDPELLFFSTYHPALLLEADGALKRPAWENLKARSNGLTGLDRDYAESLKNRGRN
jgi:DNA polymerase